MSSGFDWKTEEEKGWEEPPPTPTKARRKLPGLKPGQLILGLTVLIIGIIIVFLVVQDQLAVKSEQMRADVLASHKILIGAVQQRDPDRFLSMLSEKNAAWRELQEDVLRHQLVLSRNVLGFRGPISLSDTTAISTTQIILSPELNGAELRELLLYESLLPDGSTQNVQLELAFHYILDGTSWLLAEADVDGQYWGPWRRSTGESLTLVYPERDADYGGRLLMKLDSLLAAICSDAILECPDNFHLVVRLDPSQRTMMHLQEGPFATGILSGYGPETINVPAPTLVGRPVDEDGYIALYNGYSSWLAAVILTNYYAGEEPINEAFLAEQLIEWGLAPIPAIEKPVPFRERIAFPSNVAPPEQDIMMLCSDLEEMRLIEYDMATGAWINRSTRTHAGQNFPFSGFPVADLGRLPDYSGAVYITQEPASGGFIWRIFLWRDEIERLLLEREQPLGFWPAIVQPDTYSPENEFVMYQIYPEDPGRIPDFWRLSVSDCFDGDCLLKGSTGLPFYSPSGEYTLLVEPSEQDQLTVERGDREGLAIQSLGTGRLPTWLNNETYAYVLTEPSSTELQWDTELDPGLIEGRITPDGLDEYDSLANLFTTEQLRLTIPEVDRPEQLIINSALISEEMPERWYVITNSGNSPFEGAGYLFRYDREENTIRLLRSMKGQAFEYSTPSGHAGRFLGYVLLDGSTYRYVVLDTKTDTIEEIALSQPLDRSSDGSWFLFSEANGLRIVSPEHDFEWTLQHDLQSCHEAVWIN